MKPTEQEKLQFGIEIVAAMFAERLHNGDLDAGMIDALSETEIDRLGFSEEDLKAMPEDRVESIKKMVAFHKTRLHQQAMFMANTVLSSGLISQMQPEWVAILPLSSRSLHPELKDDTLILFDTREVRRFGEDNLPRSIMTHYLNLTQPPTK